MSSVTKTAFGKDVLPLAIRPWATGERPPAGSIPVHTYAEYKKLVGKWVSGKLDDTLIIVGSAGIGKSEQALAGLSGVRHCYLKGQASKFGVYLQLFEHLHQPVVLDDVDALLGSKEVTGLLKMLLETRSPRTLQWTTASAILAQTLTPTAFATRSRTMILTNDLGTVSKNFAAVLDRATIIWFAPSAAEIHRYAGTWFDDKTVYEFVGERIHGCPHPSCRYYYHGKKWKDAGLDWKKMINEQMFPSNSKAMIVLALETKFKSGKERVAAWKEETGETEQAYWATKRAVDLKAGKMSARGKAISEGMKRRHAERKAGAALVA